MNNKLDIWKVVSGAFEIPWQNRRNFVLALANPILLIVVLKLSWFYAEEHIPVPLRWLLYLLYLVLFTMLAVTCHRLVLLKVEAVNSRIALFWSGREFRFLLWLIVMMLISVGIKIVFSTVIINCLPFIQWSEISNQNPASIILSGVKIISIYVCARLAFIFPAISVGDQISLKTCWKLSENNGWRLVITVGILPWILSQFLFIFQRESASVYEVIILTVLACVLFVFEITAISLSYYELTKEK